MKKPFNRWAGMFGLLAGLLLTCCESPLTSTPGAVNGQAQSPIETPPFVSPLAVDATATADAVVQPIVMLLPSPSPVALLPEITRIELQDGRSFGLITMATGWDRFHPPCDFNVSPDGNWVAVDMCHSYGGNWIYVLGLPGGQDSNSVTHTRFDSRRLIFNGTTFFRGWLPDSQRILVMVSSLEIVDINTGGRQALTPRFATTPGYVTVTDAAIAPDGETIVYTNIQEDALYLIDVEGNDLVTVPAPIPSPGDRPENLTWSPYGKWIAYTWDQSKMFGAGPLWLASASGDDARQVSPPGTLETMIAWSPDASQMAVTRFNDIDNLWTDYLEPSKWASELWLTKLEDDSWNQLTHMDGKAAWAPRWTPDGLSIVFLSNLSGQPQIWLINADGSGLQQLTFDDEMSQAVPPLSFGVLP